ncbi:hypothetical protein ABZ721_31880 [Streptomyces sp. NPDC006733]|uniref:hypothetical protein n=1 Tax=Streptomyces sp. NPDC006733 TaxID=3155460 RepID=UPI0033CDA137
MAFPTARFEGCFPELFGFVLLDATGLDGIGDGSPIGKNLLELFSTSERGDQVVRDGIAIPAQKIDPGFYTVLVRHARSPAPWQDPKVSSAGWVLHVQSGELLLCGLGYLTQWTPDHPRHRRMCVPPGWYEVEIRGYVVDPDDPDDAAYEFVLSGPTGTRPTFCAHLDDSLNVIDSD